MRLVWNGITFELGKLGQKPTLLRITQLLPCAVTTRLLVHIYYIYVNIHVNRFFGESPHLVLPDAWGIVMPKDYIIVA